MATVIQIRLSLSNSFLVLGEQPILVDTGSPKDGKKLLRKLAQHGVQNLALILHTHGHSDHCGSTKQLKETTSAPTAIHPADAAVMETGRNQATKPTSSRAKLLHWLVNDEFPPVRPDVLLPDEMSLQEELRLVEITRQQMCRVLRLVAEDAWDCTAVHSETGLVTLRGLLLHAVNHLRHHITFIEEKRRALSGGLKNEAN